MKTILNDFSTPPLKKLGEPNRQSTQRFCDRVKRNPGFAIFPHSLCIFLAPLPKGNFSNLALVPEVSWHSMSGGRWSTANHISYHHRHNMYSRKVPDILRKKESYREYTLCEVL